VKIREVEYDLFNFFLPTLIEISARDPYEAYEKTLEAFDNFRSVMNLLSQSGKYTIQAGQPRPIAKYLAGPIQIVFSEDGLEQLTYIENRPSLNIRKNVVEVTHIDNAISFSNDLALSSDKLSTRQLLIDAIRRYGVALDTTQWHITFLSLWQVLELISISQPGDQRAKQRIKTLLARNEYLKDLLNILPRTRNNLVHRGVFPSDAGFLEVQMLKLVVDAAIIRLWELRDDLPTISSVKEYYSYVSLSDSVIAIQISNSTNPQQIEVLNFIQKSRNK
jgi:hypothetical protein